MFTEFGIEKFGLYKILVNPSVKPVDEVWKWCDRGEWRYRMHKWKYQDP